MPVPGQNPEEITAKKEKIESKIVTGKKLFVTDENGKEITLDITGETIDGNIFCRKDEKKYFLRFPMTGDFALLKNNTTGEEISVEISKIKKI